MGAGVVVLISTVVGEENFLEWGWRIPFFIALPLGIIGLYLRHALEETPAFQQHVDKMEQGDREGLQDGPKVSFREIATKHWRSLLTCTGLVISTNVTYYMLLTYMPSYLSHNLHYPEDHGVLIIIAIMVGMISSWVACTGLVNPQASFSALVARILRSFSCCRGRYRNHAQAAQGLTSTGWQYHQY